MNLDLGNAVPTSGAFAQLRRAVLVADPGNGMRWLGWTRGWRTEADASDAVERLETLSVSRQIADVAGFLRSADGTWIVSRGGLMPESDPGHRYWRDALQLDRDSLERIRANPFRVMPQRPPATAEQGRGVDLPPVPAPAPATADMDTARIRELRTRPWGRASWNIETLLAAALDVDHTLITGSAVSLTALELLVLLLPPSLRPEFTFHTYALAEPRKPVPRLVFTQFEDDWLFPETAAFGHRLPATELRITKRARNAASELLGLLDTPDRLAEAHATYESLSAHVTRAELVLLREVETVLSLARMLAVREHGHPGAGIRVLEQELARIGPTDWLGPESAEPERVRIDVLTGLLLDAFAPKPLGGAVVDAVQSGHDHAAPLLVMRRFLDRHAPGSSEVELFAREFQRLPRAAWPSESTDDARELGALIERIAPEPIAPTELPDDWETEVQSAGESRNLELHANKIGAIAPQRSEIVDAYAPETSEISLPSPEAETSPETEVLRTLVATLAAQASEARLDAEYFAPGAGGTQNPLTHGGPPSAGQQRPTTTDLESALRETAHRDASSARPNGSTLLATFLRELAPEPEAREEASTPIARSDSSPATDVPVDPAHARFTRPIAPRGDALPDALEPLPVRESAPPAPDAIAPDLVSPVLMPAEDFVQKPIGRSRRAFAMAATVIGVLVLGFGARSLLDGRSAADTGSALVAGAMEEVVTEPGVVPDPDLVFDERIAQARDLAAARDWAGAREAIGVVFASLSAAEAFARDSLLANASLQLARAMRQNPNERTQLFVNVFEHTSSALAAVAPFAPGTDALRLMQAEACLEGSLDCDSGEVVENLVFAVRSLSAEISGRANELLTRTPPVGPDPAILVSNESGAGRL
jgi:hypothetical protein